MTSITLMFSPSLLYFQFYLHNHLSFVLYYHRERLEEDNDHDYRVVRFEVVPQSVKVEGRLMHNRLPKSVICEIRLSGSACLAKLWKLLGGTKLLP